jgi:hypothetical protein
MDRLKEFRIIARECGFVVVEESKGGTVMWLKKMTADSEDRICLDSLTKSATAYWAAIPWKINSKTFREASAMREWILARPVVLAT